MVCSTTSLPVFVKSMLHATPSPIPRGSGGWDSSSRLVYHSTIRCASMSSDTTVPTSNTWRTVSYVIGIHRTSQVWRTISCIQRDWCLETYLTQICYLPCFSPTENAIRFDQGEMKSGFIGGEWGFESGCLEIRQLSGGHQRFINFERYGFLDCIYPWCIMYIVFIMRIAFSYPIWTLTQILSVWKRVLTKHKPMYMNVQTLVATPNARETILRSYICLCVIHSSTILHDWSGTILSPSCSNRRLFSHTFSQVDTFPLILLIRVGCQYVIGGYWR